ncbi:MAG: HNH endonuclease [Aggregatilineales bacterium]
MAYIPVEIRRRVHEAAADRCGYCHMPQRLIPYPMEIEHIVPSSKGGTDDELNLWLACSTCNSHKSDKLTGYDSETEAEVRLFNPRTQNWYEHFEWIEDGLRLKGLTPAGRVTIVALHMNDNPLVLNTRKMWMDVNWHPPE